MAKPELLATIRDRYRASSKREKSRILDEFIPELTSGGDRPPSQAWHQAAGAVRQRLGAAASGEKGRRIYDDAVCQALIVVWEAADWSCGKRLKAALPTWIWTLGCVNDCCRPAPPPWTGCSSPSGHRRDASSDAGGISRRAAIFRYGPSPIGMRRRRDSWRLTWWSTTAAPGGVP